MKSILVVEDLEDDFILLQRAFSQAKIAAEVKRAEDGVQARQLLLDIVAARPNKTLPAFVLSDIKMPQLNGFELLQWIRAHEVLRRLPVVMMTSSSQEVDIAKAYDLGANGYVVKPNSFQETQACARALEQFWMLHNRGPTFW